MVRACASPAPEHWVTAPNPAPVPTVRVRSGHSWRGHVTHVRLLLRHGVGVVGVAGVADETVLRLASRVLLLAVWICVAHGGDLAHWRKLASL